MRRAPLAKTAMLMLAAMGCGETMRARMESDAAGSGETGGVASAGSIGGVQGGEPNSAVMCEPIVEPAPRAAGDPGVAGTMYGPIMGGTATTREGTIQLVGTAAAVVLPEGSHLFFTTHPTDSAPVVYMSILVDDPAWSPGVYEAPLTGSLEVTTGDDCSYRLDFTTMPSGSFRLEITESTQGQPEYYLRGVLDAELPSLHERPPLLLHMTIN